MSTQERKESSENDCTDCLCDGHMGIVNGKTLRVKPMMIYMVHPQQEKSRQLLRQLPSRLVTIETYITNKPN